MALIHGGQVCMAVKRIYVHASIYDTFIKALVEHVKKLPAGWVSPLQNAAQYERVNGYIEDIKKSGQHIALGGEPAVNGDSTTSNGNAAKSHGFHVPVTIVDNPPESSRIIQEEPFGPVVPVAKWEGSDEDIVDRANKTEYGLGASVWSKDVARAERMARRLQVGSSWVNMHFVLHPDVPFGGHKLSGIGLEYGKEGLKAFMNIQTIWKPKA